MDQREDSGLLEIVRELQREVATLRAESEIRRLQYLYGYYDDYRDWERLIGLFAEGECSVEIGSRGKYRGKERVAQFFREIIGQNRAHLTHNEIYNHLQLQMVITVAPDGEHAHARSRALIQGTPGGGPAMMWAEGVYENRYVRQNGQWKIEHMFWAANFYASVTGIDTLRFAGTPPSKDLPPDAPPQPIDPQVGRALVPYHF